MSVCKDSNVEVSYGTRKNFFDVPVNSVHRFRPEGLVGECIIGIDADCFSVEIDKYTVEPACTDIDIDRDIRLEKACSRSRTACSTSCERRNQLLRAGTIWINIVFSCPMVKYRTKIHKKE